MVKLKTSDFFENTSWRISAIFAGLFLLSTRTTMRTILAASVIPFVNNGYPIYRMLNMWTMASAQSASLKKNSLFSRNF